MIFQSKDDTNPNVKRNFQPSRNGSITIADGKINMDFLNAENAEKGSPSPRISPITTNFLNQKCSSVVKGCLKNSRQSYMSLCSKFVSICVQPWLTYSLIESFRLIT